MDRKKIKINLNRVIYVFVQIECMFLSIQHNCTIIMRQSKKKNPSCYLRVKLFYSGGILYWLTNDVFNINNNNYY